MRATLVFILGSTVSEGIEASSGDYCVLNT